MNRARWMILPVLGVLLFGAAVAGAYHAGTRHDDHRAVIETISPSGSDGQPVQVVRLDSDRFDRHGGFFPFFFGPLFFILFLVLIFSLVRRGRWGWRGYPPYGPWGGGPGNTFEEWHQRQHSPDTGKDDSPPST